MRRTKAQKNKARGMKDPQPRLIDDHLLKRLSKKYKGQTFEEKQTALGVIEDGLADSRKNMTQEQENSILAEIQFLADATDVDIRQLGKREWTVPTKLGAFFGCS